MIVIYRKNGNREMYGYRFFLYKFILLESTVHSTGIISSWKILSVIGGILILSDIYDNICISSLVLDAVNLPL